jgi:hypothetical protein
MSRNSVTIPADGHDAADDALETDALVAAVTRSVSDDWPISVLNPEAGHHHIAIDPRELAAALRAGNRTWRRFPYYELRYGERGRRFTRSDSAWIVTVAKESLDSAERQLRWLGTLLAARGMPRWLLELHLAELHAELVSAAPDNRAAYDRLLGVAAMFRDERLRHLDEGTSAELALAFDLRVGPGPKPAVPQAGELLVAAVADERSGVGGLDNLLEWLADPARFSAEWIAATTETVAAARARAR